MSSYNFPGARGTFVGIGTGAYGEFHGGPAQSPPSDLPQIVDELAALLRRHAAGLDEPELAQSAFSAIRAEVSAPEPRWNRVASRAALLEEATASQPDVAALAHQLNEEAARRVDTHPSPPQPADRLPVENGAPADRNSYNFPQAVGTFVGIGTGATGLYRSSSTQAYELSKVIAELRAALAHNRASVVDPDTAERAIVGIEDELLAPSSQTSGRVSTFLQTIAAAAPSVAAVGNAVQAISAAVKGMVGA